MHKTIKIVNMILSGEILIVHRNIISKDRFLMLSNILGYSADFELNAQWIGKEATCIYDYIDQR